MKIKLDLNRLFAVSIAMSSEEARYYLCGVRLYEREGKLVYEGTDGHRLIRLTEKKTEGDFKGLDIIIPAALIIALPHHCGIPHRIYDEDTGEIHEEDDLPPAAVLSVLSVSDGKVPVISIALDTGVTYEAKAVDGKYPDFDKVMPREISCRNLDFDAVAFNPSYMNDFAHSLRFLGHKGVSLRINGALDKPMYMTAEDPHWLWEACLMPRKTHAVKYAD